MENADDYKAGKPVEFVIRLYLYDQICNAVETVQQHQADECSNGGAEEINCGVVDEREESQRGGMGKDAGPGCDGEPEAQPFSQVGKEAVCAEYAGVQGCYREEKNGNQPVCVHEQPPAVIVCGAGQGEQLQVFQNENQKRSQEQG